jgi:hypothetical protein
MRPDRFAIGATPDRLNSAAPVAIQGRGRQTGPPDGRSMTNQLGILSLDMSQEDRILRIVVAAGSTLGLADAQASVREGALLFDAGWKAGCLVDMRGLRSMTREARQYYGGEEPPRRFTGVALVVGSPLNRAIGNFFLGLNRPRMPTRLFDTVEDARAWLQGLA